MFVNKFFEKGHLLILLEGDLKKSPRNTVLKIDYMELYTCALRVINKYKKNTDQQEFYLINKKEH